ncbi:MAG: discoidin domain-containing protein [Planctomycetia bacterium]|nr:discoidin domain-containing protein [Planctomycetia bacterium]
MKKLNIALIIIAILLTQIDLSISVEKKRISVSVQADSENRDYEAFQAMDGNPDTLWHTQFNSPAIQGKPLIPLPVHCGYGYGCNETHSLFLPQENESVSPNNVPPPHFIIVDLGDSYELNGFVYSPRKKAENGTIGDYEFYLSQNIDDWGKPIAKGNFFENLPATIDEKTKNDNTEKRSLTNPNDALDAPKRVVFDLPKNGRFVKLVALTEINNQPFTSIAELELLSDSYEFVASSGNSLNDNRNCWTISKNDVQQWIIEWLGDDFRNDVNSTTFLDIIEQYNHLCKELPKRDYYDYVKDQTANEQALIWESDRDPLDVVLRRTAALLDELKTSEIEKLRCGESLEFAEKTLNFVQEQNNLIPIDDQKNRFKMFMQTLILNRSLLYSLPELNFNEILFVKKNRANYNHICDQFYGRSAVPGGGLFVLSDVFDMKTVPKVRNLLENSTVQNESRLFGQKLENGSFLSPDLSFEGDRIAFAFVECKGNPKHIDHLDLSRGHTESGYCYHIFSCKADGSDLKMITDGTWNDFDPCFLPNGRMAFISERRGGYLRCGRDCPNYTLFDMNEDGSKIRCLSYHETNEWNPNVTNDGKIVWTRWDYIDRFGCIAHHPWITTLDGRDPRSVHGNFSQRHLRADAELDVRAIPNSSKFMATAAPHHGQCYGSILLIDPQIEDDDIMSPVKRLTPDVGFPESQGGGQVWGTPWPLSESLFLAVADYSMQPGLGVEGQTDLLGNYGIYLADAFGNRALIYRDQEIGCASPIPFLPRQKPIVLPALTPNEEIADQPFVAPPADFNATRPEATVTISNIYESLRPWPEKTQIKSLRVVQIYCMSVPSGYPPHETGYREKTSLDSVNLARCSLGTVPVDDDGSVHFKVSALCEIYFQALDENGLAVQSMRSGTSLKEGENLSCLGCHEPKHQTPIASSTLPTAFLREPSQLKPEAKGSRPFSYPELIQPILDNHCVACHSDPEKSLDPLIYANLSEKHKSPMNLSREPIENHFFASYNNLVQGGFAFNDYGDPLRTTPGKFGARASKLYSLIQNHYGVEKELSRDDFAALALWLDLLSNFYGVYEKEGAEKQLRGEKAFPTLE